MFGNCPVVGDAPSCARPMPRNRPKRSKGLSKPISRSVSWSGKSSHHDAVAQTPEARRQPGERLFGETLEISERRRLQARPRLAFRHHVTGAQYIADL